MAPKMSRLSNLSDDLSLTVSQPIAASCRTWQNGLAISAAALLCVASIGCGKSEVSQTASAGSSATTSAGTVAAASMASPTDVVSQFLDQVRRGGAGSDAGRFLTQKAQSELKRIGRSVQPIGSPQARFDVVRAVNVPDEDNAMLVESRWTEPNPDGQSSEYQVVWSVEKETQGWRISGLAMELDGSEDPTIVDFENGAMMQQLLPDDSESQQASASQDVPSQAASPSDGLNR